MTSDLPELHSTPWSSVRVLDPASRRAQDFLRPRPVRTGNSSSLELDLDTLLSQKYSGESESFAECRLLITLNKQRKEILSGALFQILQLFQTDGLVILHQIAWYPLYHRVNKNTNVNLMEALEKD